MRSWYPDQKKPHTERYYKGQSVSQFVSVTLTTKKIYVSPYLAENL